MNVAVWRLSSSHEDRLRIVRTGSPAGELPLDMSARRTPPLVFGDDVLGGPSLENRSSIDEKVARTSRQGWRSDRG